MKSIHQIVDTIVPGDAISNDCIQIQEYLHRLGYHSKIFVRNSLIRNKHILRGDDQIPADAGIIFHHSTFTPLLKHIAKLSNKKAIIYHNITPAAFFKSYNYQLYKIFKEGERQNYILNDINFDGVIGDSKYNLSLMQEFIKNAEYEDVLPPFLSLQFLKQKKIKSEKIIKNDEIFTILFVGRFAPNKRQDDIVKVFEYYSKFLNPKAELFLIGHYAYGDGYFNQIRNYIKDNDISNVYIKANLTSEELSYIYKRADLLLSMSEHEGFCIPIIESIHHEVPVLAYRIPALEELLDAEYLIESKNYKDIAERIYLLEKNKKSRSMMIEKQKKILDQFKEEEIKKRFKNFINTVFHL